MSADPVFVSVELMAKAAQLELTRMLLDLEHSRTHSGVHFTSANLNVVKNRLNAMLDETMKKVDALQSTVIGSPTTQTEVSNRSAEAPTKMPDDTIPRLVEQFNIGEKSLTEKLEAAIAKTSRQIQAADNTPRISETAIPPSSAGTPSSSSVDVQSGGASTPSVGEVPQEDGSSSQLLEPPIELEEAGNDDANAPIAPVIPETIDCGEAFFQTMDNLKFGAEDFYDAFLRHEAQYLDNKTTVIQEFPDGHAFNQAVKHADDFNKVFFVHNKDGLGISTPDLTFSNLHQWIDQNEKIGVIKSLTQLPKKMTFGRVFNVLQNPGRRAKNMVFNIASFEVSKRRLGKELIPPTFVLENSMVVKLEKKNDEIAEQKKKEEEEAKAMEAERSEEPGPSSSGASESSGSTESRLIQLDARHLPTVSKYLLLTTKKSMMDVHVDFSGTAVFYHVIRGTKLFYIAPPTDENLAIYEEIEKKGKKVNGWKGTAFRGQWSRVMIKAGQTAFIPPGYIHFVVTPEDSIVFGGNFFLFEELKMHFRVSEMEWDGLRTDRLGWLDVIREFYDFMNAYVYFFFIEQLKNAKNDQNLLSIGRMFLEKLAEHHQTGFKISAELKSEIKITVRLLKEILGIGEEEEPILSVAAPRGRKRKAIGIQRKPTGMKRKSTGMQLKSTWIQQNPDETDGSAIAERSSD